MTLRELFYFSRLLKIKEVHAKRLEHHEEITGLADAASKLAADELWKHGPTATEFVPVNVIDELGLDDGKHT